MVTPVVRALVTRQVKSEPAPSEPPGQSLHEQFKERFEGFGRPLLTKRENEVVRLLLRGHSSKSVARELGIAVETARVHRKNIYTKLGVASQGDLFALFISELPS